MYSGSVRSGLFSQLMTLWRAHPSARAAAVWLWLWRNRQARKDSPVKWLQS